MGNNYIDSSILFSPPSITKGTARCGDIFGQLDEYNISDTSVEADAKAIYNDWLVLGNDFKQSINIIDQQLKSQCK